MLENVSSLAVAEYFFRSIDESFCENFTSLTPNSISQFVVRYGNSRLASFIVGITLVFNFYTL